MNSLNMPGFTAEAALFPTIRTYCKSFTKATAQGIIVPQRDFIKCFRECHDKQGHGPVFCFVKCA